MSLIFKQVYTSFAKYHQEKDYHGVAKTISDIPKDCSTKYATHYKALVLGSLSAALRTNIKCPIRLKHLSECCDHLWTLLTTLPEMHSVITTLEIHFVISWNSFAEFSPVVLRFIRSAVLQTIELRATNEDHMLNIFRAIFLSLKIETFTGLVGLKHTAELLELCVKYQPNDQLLQSILVAVRVCQGLVAPKMLMGKLKKYFSDTNGTNAWCGLVVIAQMLSLVKPEFPDGAMKLDAVAICGHLINIFKLHAKPPQDSFIAACQHCKGNLFPHTRLCLAATGYKYINELFSTDLCLPPNLLDNIIDEMIVVQNLKCSQQPSHKQVVQYHVQELVCTNRPTVNPVVVVLLENMCRNHKQIGPIEAYIKYANFFKFLSLHSSKGDDRTALLAHYLQAINVISNADDADISGPESRLKVPLFAVCKKQQQMTEFFAIDESLEAMNWTYMGAIPIQRIDPVELLIHVVRYATITGLLSDELRFQLINRILDICKTTEHRLQSLRLTSTFISTQMPKDIHERLRNFFSEIKHSPGPQEKHIWHLVHANMYYFEYHSQHTEALDENRNEPVDFRDMESMRFLAKHNIAKECSMVRQLQLALSFYAKFITPLDANECRHTFTWEANFALYSLLKIGQHMTMRLFREDAMIAYRLLLRLGRKMDDVFAQLQAISFIAANPQHFEDVESKKTLMEIMKNGGELLAQMIGQFDTLSARKQRWLLHCMMNIGLNYIGSGKEVEGKELLRFAENMLVSMEAKTIAGGSDTGECLLRLRHSIVLLSLVTKHRMPSPCPVIIFTEALIKSFNTMRSNDDTLVFLTMLFEALWDVTHYSMARYDYDELEPVMGIMMKMTARYGCAYKTIKILLAWAHLELYKEKHEQCSQRLNVVDLLLPTCNDLRTNKSKTDHRASNSVSAAPHLNSPERRIKVEVVTLDDIPCDNTYNKYLIEHHTKCDCFVCKRPFVQRVFFELSIIHCRSLYIQSEIDHSMNEFRKAHDHWLNRRDILDPEKMKVAVWESIEFGQVVYRMFWYYAQCLIRAGKANDSLEMYKTALSYVSKMRETAVVHDLKMQISSIVAAQSKKLEASERNVKNRLYTAQTPHAIEPNSNSLSTSSSTSSFSSKAASPSISPSPSSSAIPSDSDDVKAHAHVMANHSKSSKENQIPAKPRNNGLPSLSQSKSKIIKTSKPPTTKPTPPIVTIKKEPIAVFKQAQPSAKTAGTNIDGRSKIVSKPQAGLNVDGRSKIVSKPQAGLNVDSRNANASIHVSKPPARVRNSTTMPATTTAPTTEQALATRPTTRSQRNAN